MSKLADRIRDPVVKVGPPERKGDICLDKTFGRSAVEGVALKMVAEETLRLQQLQHGVRQLDLVTGAALLLFKQSENLGLENIATVDVQIRRRGSWLWLFHHPGDLETRMDLGSLADDAVFMGLVGIAFLNADDVVSGLLVKFDHLRHAALSRTA